MPHWIVLTVLLLAAVVASAPQEKADKEPARPPERGDQVEARGCLRGSALERAEVTRPGSTAIPGELFTFRLTGKKSLIKTLRAEHDGHADIILGELATDLPRAAGSPGARVGNTRIVIGVGPGRGMGPAPPPPMPVLKVNGFEHTDITCR